MARKPPKGKSLAEVNPELAKQWHPTENGDLTPSDVSTGSGAKVWWKCSEGDDHEWQAGVGKRNSGRGCPICAGKKIVLSNCLATLNPSLSKEWHPTKNGDLTPYDVTIGSSKNVYWKCNEADDHEWQSPIKIRNNYGTRCSICLGLIVVKSNCLATTHPALALEWHPTKNREITTHDVSVNTNKSYWWKCDKGDDHEWEASISSRKDKEDRRGTGCPVCEGLKVVKSNCLATTHPALALEWHPTKNESLKPQDVVAGSEKKVWWKCDKGDDHEWKASIGNRSKGKGCSVCAGRTVVNSNCLATIDPKLAKEWHPTKNGELTPYDVLAGSHTKVWWKCDKGDDHVWKSQITSRLSGIGCSICAGKTVVNSNCLATIDPELAKEWHPTKNGELTPMTVSAGTSRRVWWKCDKGDDHVWKAQISSRSQGNGCAVCSNHLIVNSNCLATTHSKFVKEWHPSKNGELTPYDVGAGSNMKVWWKCDKGDDHEWKTSIGKRVSDQNCPFCTLTPQSKQELTITFELIKFFKDINPKGFKTRVKGKLWSIDIYIPQLKLGIEFDGSYWHKDKRELDKLKTENLEEEGFEIFRVREEPLKKIFDDDIMSKQPFNPKQLTNDILAQIMKMYELDTKKIAKIQSYIAKKELQNEKGLDKYIEMILTEKAEKKN
jgi:predicted secreted protein